MRVKIGNTVYDSENEPIMLLLSNVEKQHISNMPYDAHKYCSYPEGREESEIEEFMKL